MGTDLQAKVSQESLHVLTVSPYTWQELKRNVSVITFAVEMLKNTLTKNSKCISPLGVDSVCF